MTRVRIAQPDIEEDVSAECLIESAVASGRYVYVTTYHDGATPIRASLLFKTTADAETCARVLRESSRHPSAVLTDIAGPARAASVGARCGPRPVWCRACAGGNATMSKADTADEQGRHGRRVQRRPRGGRERGAEAMKTNDDKALHLYVCCGETVSAHSPEDAGELFLDASGETAQAMADDPGATWAQIPDDRVLTVRTENGPTERETRTAAEWADAIGRGLAWSDN